MRRGSRSRAVRVDEIRAGQPGAALDGRGLVALPSRPGVHVQSYRLIVDGGGEDHRGARDTPAAVGSAEHVADWFEEWFRADAADGFNVQSPYLWDQLDRFANQVVPIL